MGRDSFVGLLWGEIPSSDFRPTYLMPVRADGVLTPCHSCRPYAVHPSKDASWCGPAKVQTKLSFGKTLSVVRSEEAASSSTPLSKVHLETPARVLLARSVSRGLTSERRYTHFARYSTVRDSELWDPEVCTNLSVYYWCLSLAHSAQILGRHFLLC